MLHCLRGYRFRGNDGAGWNDGLVWSDDVSGMAFGSVPVSLPVSLPVSVSVSMPVSVLVSVLVPCLVLWLSINAGHIFTPR